jgi:hypothetical protein
MNKKWLTIVILGVFLIGSSQGILALNTNQSNSLQINSAEDESWTVMVYMAADNYMKYFYQNDINAMKVAGSTDQVNIIVLKDTQENQDSKILRITKGGTEVLEEKGELNMGDSQTLTDFIDYSTQNYPADHYALFLYGHGKFNDVVNGVDILAFNKICRDDSHTDYLDIANGELIQALDTLNNPVHFDIIGFDSCLTASLAVAYEIKNYANYMIASQDDQFHFDSAQSGLFDYGMNYNFLEDLVDSPSTYSADIESLCSLIVDNYYNTDDRDIATLSAVDLSKIPQLVNSFGDLAEKLSADKIEYLMELRKSYEKTKKFGNYYPGNGDYVPTFVDFYSYAENLKEKITDNSEIDGYLTEILGQISTAIIADNNDDDAANGINICFTWPFDTGYNGAYSNFLLSDLTQWDDILRWISNNYAKNDWPNNPIAEGAEIAQVGKEYTITFSGTDPDAGDELEFEIVWNLGHSTEMVGPYDQGEIGTANQVYSRDDITSEPFDIFIRAYDSWGKFSGATRISVLVRYRGRSIEFLILDLLAQFPILAKILNLVTT